MRKLLPLFVILLMCSSAIAEEQNQEEVVTLQDVSFDEDVRSALSKVAQLNAQRMSIENAIIGIFRSEGELEMSKLNTMHADLRLIMSEIDDAEEAYREVLLEKIEQRAEEGQGFVDRSRAKRQLDADELQDDLDALIGNPSIK